MPTLTLNLRYLFSLVGRKLSDSELLELLEKSKMSLERIEGEELEVEVTTDRLDLLSEEGIARHFKGLLGIEKGIPRYEVFRSEVEGIVDESVIGIRPGFALGVVLGVELGEDGLLSLMHLQEKIHQTWGRGRRKVSIGVHDFDKLKPPITYAGEKPEDIRFVPLGETDVMDGREIIRKHEKGVVYGHIIADKPLF
ncbi:MAG TPA: phenylalanine--tRNA ligase subunit beta, partial [Candidatus Korarchaeota archaeon]|nr:phenylalanine--tRNA ligase subunit beta [Candidatus Korarchaeota archaeon]